MQVWLNGQLVDKAEAKVSVYDHGFLYGDGIFEGIRVYEGTIFKLKEHIDRLYESAKTIHLEIPLSPEELTQATVDTVAANKRKDGYIRLVVSRGYGDLGIDPQKCETPTIVIICDGIALYPQKFYEEGIKLVTASVRRTPIQCLDPRIKSLNYLNNIMAKIEARRSGAPEAIMLNTNGRVAECTADNLFMVKNKVLITPSLMEGALAGITRSTVMDLARSEQIKTAEGSLALHDLYNADECFLTGTGAEIVPVIEIDGREIGGGKPGPVQKQLLEAFKKIRVLEGTKVSYDGAAAI